MKRTKQKHQEFKHANAKKKRLEILIIRCLWNTDNKWRQKGKAYLFLRTGLKENFILPRKLKTPEKSNKKWNWRRLGRDILSPKEQNQKSEENKLKQKQNWKLVNRKNSQILGPPRRQLNYEELLNRKFQVTLTSQWWKKLIIR